MPADVILVGGDVGEVGLQQQFCCYCQIMHPISEAIIVSPDRHGPSHGACPAAAERLREEFKRNFRREVIAN